MAYFPANSMGGGIHSSSYTGTTVGQTNTVLVTNLQPSNVIILGPITESGGDAVVAYVTSSGYWAFRYLDKLSNQQRTIGFSYVKTDDVISD